MKELSIEEKARAYDEAIKRAKSKIKNDKDHVLYEDDVIEIFPELKESEDEMIRKQIISFLKEFEHDHYRSLDFSSWIAWLEKQGEQESQGKSALEAIKEENVDNANKVEPKFNLYDWVVTDKGDTVQIGAVNNGYYTLFNGMLFNGMDFDMSYVDKYWHKWTIKDAKDGDVLVASDDSVFIFARVDGYGCIHHIALANDGVLKINLQLTYAWESVKGVKPATKKQHDKLEKAMLKAGYKWDADKKELIKL